MSEEKERDESSDLHLETPVGKILLNRIKLRHSDILSMIVACVLGLNLYMMWQHLGDTKDNGKQLALMSCLLSVPTEKREAEYFNKNSLCRAISGNIDTKGKTD